jgi:hypothetical protein
MYSEPGTGYLPAVKDMLKRQLADPMVKEAFLEAATAHAIRFTPATEQAKTSAEYHKVRT